MATKEQEITQIGGSVTIKGDISGKSDVRIAGNVNGSINSTLITALYIIFDLLNVSFVFLVFYFFSPMLIVFRHSLYVYELSR